MHRYNSYADKALQPKAFAFFMKRIKVTVAWQILCSLP
jgi:hypothetical protein